MIDKPLVSIICVSMNHENYVEQGIRSFLNQTYSNLEILYVDNASSDNTYALAEKVFESAGVSHQTFKRERSYNTPENFNFLLKKAKGKYLCFISCDDWMKPEYVETLVREYEAQPQVGLMYSNGWYYWEDKKKYEIAENKKFISGHIFDHIFLHKVIFPIGVMIKKEVFDIIGLYDESLVIEDYDMWLRIADKFEIGYSKEPCIYYRKHFKSMTLSKTCGNIKDYIKTAEKYKDHRLFEKVSRDFRKLYIYCHYLHKRNYKALKMIFDDFRFERFYFSLIAKLTLNLFGFVDTEKRRLSNKSSD